MTTELLEWHDAGLIKPDADITVLCWGGTSYWVQGGYKPTYTSAFAEEDL